jgi:hypothetical protein
VFQDGWNALGATPVPPTVDRTVVLVFMRTSLRHFFIKFPSLGLKLWRQLAAAAAFRLSEWRLARSPRHFADWLPPLRSPLVTVSRLLFAAQRASVLRTAAESLEVETGASCFLATLPLQVLERLAGYLDLKTVQPFAQIWQRNAVDGAGMLLVLEGVVHTRGDGGDGGDGGGGGGELEEGLAESCLDDHEAAALATPRPATTHMATHEAGALVNKRYLPFTVSPPAVFGASGHLEAVCSHGRDPSSAC